VIASKVIICHVEVMFMSSICLNLFETSMLFTADGTNERGFSWKGNVEYVNFYF
jgi:hypothetical protein